MIASVQTNRLIAPEVSIDCAPDAVFTADCRIRVLVCCASLTRQWCPSTLGTHMTRILHASFNASYICRIIYSVIALLAIFANKRVDAFNISTPFNTATALTQQGALARGPNSNYCFPPSPDLPGGSEPFQYLNNDTTGAHAYQVYDVYNPGAASCRNITLSWSNGDCGDLELGLFVYNGSFNPNNITQNFLGAGFQDDRGKGKFGGSSNLSEYRYSPGFDRHGGFLGQDYHTDWLNLPLNVPAYSNLKIVIVAKRLASAPPLSCATPTLFSKDLTLAPVSFKISDTQSNEFNPPGGATLDFVISLESIAATPVSIDWNTTNGLGANGGVAGVDYVASSGTVTFQPGQDSKLVSVPIISNTTIQPNRTVRVLLSNPSPGALGISEGIGIGTIIDDDTPLCRFLAPNTVPNGIVGTVYGPVNFVPTGQDAISDYIVAVSGGSLPPGLNFSFTDPPGIINAFASVAGTPTTAGTYNFTLALTCPLAEGGADNYSQDYTIVIDNGLPEVLVALPDVSALEGNAGLTPVTMTVSISTPLNTPTTFNITTQNAVASTVDSDYVAITNQQVTIPTGATQATFTVNFQGDTKFEGNEQFLVLLNHTTGTQALATSAVATILNDDAPPPPPGPIPTLPTGLLAALAMLLLAVGKTQLGKNQTKNRKNN
jgi:Calx-beta domain